ncbi:MAG: hypothetical protein AAF368_03975 [Planctomycetota bacterium]
MPRAVRPGRRFKLDHILTEPQREKLIVDLHLGRISAYAAGKKYGIAEQSVARWRKTWPEDEILMLAAREKQRSEVAKKRDAAGILMSEGDDIDNDLRWIIQRLRRAVEACEDDEQLLELAQLREMRKSLIDLAKVRGMFSNKIDVSIDLGSSPQFLMLRTIILKVLEAHPDAKAAFLEEMQALNVVEAKALPAVG